MIERRRAGEAVQIAVTNKDGVLLQKRKNTGWKDGWYDLPSGHVDTGESILDAAVRELREEVGLEALPKDLELFHIAINDAGANAPYTYIAFRVKRWKGKPILMEPDLAEELDFYPLDNLPKKVPPYVKRALADIASPGPTFSYFGTDEREQL